MAVGRGEQLLDRLVAWSPVLLLGGLAALTYWLDAQVQPPPAHADAAKRHAADIFIDNFRAQGFDTDGRLREAIGAKRAQHYADDGAIDFASPTITITDPDQPRIVVTSEAGTLSADHETVNFKGNVRATRDAPSSGATDDKDKTGPITVLADTLRVQPKRGIASTDGPVTIEETRGIIHAVGMRLDNQAHTVKLDSAVRGTLQSGSIQTPPAR